MSLSVEVGQRRRITFFRIPVRYVGQFFDDADGRTIRLRRLSTVIQVLDPTAHGPHRIGRCEPGLVGDELSGLEAIIQGNGDHYCNPVWRGYME